MKNKKLDAYEADIEKSILNYRKASSKKVSQVMKAINQARDKKSINLRINAQDLAQLKLRAEQEGIPYQTLISSILHKFTTDQLVDQKAVFKSIQLMKI